MNMILVVAFLAISSLAPNQNLQVKVKAVATGHQAVLTWSPSSSEVLNPIIGYNVYRGSTPGAESAIPLNGKMLVNINCSYTNVRTGFVTRCTYTDPSVPAGTWYWTVKASLNGTLSAASNEATGTAP